MIWFGPVPALYLPSVTSVAASTPPILVVTAAICLMRAWRANQRGRAGATLRDT